MPDEEVLHVPVGEIIPFVNQSREVFDEAELLNLSEDIKARGLLQHGVAWFDAGRGKYVLICGERRLRAIMLAGLPSMAVKVIKGNLTPGQMLAINLSENLQRRNLNVVERKSLPAARPTEKHHDQARGGADAHLARHRVEGPGDSGASGVAAVGNRGGNLTRQRWIRAQSHRRPRSSVGDGQGGRGGHPVAGWRADSDPRPHWKTQGDAEGGTAVMQARRRCVHHRGRGGPVADQGGLAACRRASPQSGEDIRGFR